MALTNLEDWNKKVKNAGIGTSCGAGDKLLSGCGSACGSGDKTLPTACGSACGSGDK